MRDLKVSYWPEDMLKRYNEGCRDWIAKLPEVRRPLAAEDILRSPPPPPATMPEGPAPYFPGPPPGSPPRDAASANEPTPLVKRPIYKSAVPVDVKRESESASFFAGL